MRTQSRRPQSATVPTSYTLDVSLKPDLVERQRGGTLEGTWNTISLETSFIAMASLKIQFLTRHRGAGTRRPPARRRSTFLHLELLHHQEKTCGGNCISGNMNVPRNACTSVCPDRSRCCFNCAILRLASRTCSSLVAATEAPPLRRVCRGPLAFAPCAYV
jgi:hypothetical protein